MEKKNNKIKFSVACPSCGSKTGYWIDHPENRYKALLYCKNDHLVEEESYIPTDNMPATGF